jgi:signal transduction histidine kinase
MVRSILALILICAWPVAAQDMGESYRVLILNSFRNSAPITEDWYNGLVRGFSLAPDLRVEIDTESPDLAHFMATDHVGDLVEFYRRNYHDRAPHLIVPAYTPALRFLLAHGEHLFPGVPIVFLGADGEFVAARQLPQHVTGTTLRVDIAGTLDLALNLHPDTRRVALIAGSDPHGTLLERQARKVLPAFTDRVELIWLRGMPLEELLEAVIELPEQTVILYLAQLQDRTGQPHVPRSTLRALSPVAKAPIYGLWDTLLGHGIIGGRLVTVEEDGFLAAKLATRILRGEAPAAVPVVERVVNPAVFDGRELARWHIDEDRLPSGSQIRYRQPPVWELYRNEIIITIAIIVVQGLLIAALLLNRRRLRRAQVALRDEYDQRKQAQSVAARLRNRLTRFGKERSLGTMATAIAHEINQPLIAIQNYAQAARRHLQSSPDATARLMGLFTKIEGQVERAGAITQRVRALVNRTDPQLQPVPLVPALNEVIQMMEPETKNRRCRILRELADLPAVLADGLQVQLVLVNLLQNALRAVCSGDRFDKLVVVDARPINDREVVISVADRGPGIPPERVADIFEPLYSGTSGGMGIGLAISQAIIDAHGGRLWYEPNPAGGAIFRFTLQIAASS